MKTTTQHDVATSTPEPAAGKPALAPPARHLFKLGLAVDLHYVVTAIQCDHGTLKPAHKWTRPQLIHWVQAQAAAGARSLVTTPARLPPERRRKNDRLVARELCGRS